MPRTDALRSVAGADFGHQAMDASLRAMVVRDGVRCSRHLRLGAGFSAEVSFVTGRSAPETASGSVREAEARRPEPTRLLAAVSGACTATPNPTANAPTRVPPAVPGPAVATSRHIWFAPLCQVKGSKTAGLVAHVYPASGWEHSSSRAPMDSATPPPYCGRPSRPMPTTGSWRVGPTCLPSLPLHSRNLG